MTDIKTEFEFDLKVPFGYESGGEQTDAHKLILTAPSNKQRTHRIKLKEYVKLASSWSEKTLLDSLDFSQEGVIDAFAKLGDSANKADGDKPDISEAYAGAGIIDSMYACPDVKMTAAIEEFLLLLLDVCMVEGVKKLTKPLFEKMSPDDTDRLFGAYISNFISGS